MSEIARHHPITIDLNQFKLRIDLKKKIELTLQFDSPSRKFYLSVIALVVNEMKRLGKVTTIPLLGHHDVLALLNESVGGSAGSSREGNLLPRIYKKWKNALPNLEEAPLFKVLGRKKKYEEGTTKSYSFTEAEKDNWANLFEYMGSEDKVRLKFAIDRLGARLDDVVILYEDSVNGDAWERFLSSLENKPECVPEAKPDQPISEGPEPAIILPMEQSTGSRGRYPWISLIAIMVVIAGIATWAIWESSFKLSTSKRASIEKMAFPLPDKPSIAVMPFVNLSDDKSQEYFSDGLTDDLITDLSKISGLFVIARNSTFAYKGKSVKVRQVAEELGVRYVLEGSVRRAGDQIRINAQFVDAMTGRHLWAERYDGSMSNIFSLQDKINQKIVAALAVKVNEGEKARLAQKWTNNIAAYDEYLKGRDQSSRLTKEDFDKAEACFNRALDLDPKFSQARAALASLYKIKAGQAWEKGPAAYTKNQLWAAHQLREAMKEPTAIAYRLSGEKELEFRQHDVAISQLEKALSLDPSDPSVHSFLSWALSMAGRPAEAMEYAERAIRIDPINPDRWLLHLGVIHFCLGNMEEAATRSEKMLKMHPEFIGAAALLASASAHLGRNEQARAAFETYRTALGNLPLTLTNVMFHWPFKEQRLAELFAEGLIKAGMPAQISDYIHVSKKDLITRDDLREFFYPSTITGYGPGGAQWSSDFAKDGTVTLRAPYVPGGADTGRSWLEGDKLWINYPKYTFGMAYARTTFKNPKGTPEQRNEYVSFTDIGIATFSRAR